MQVEISGIRHPKDGYEITSHIIDVTEVFKKRDIAKDRGYCVYYFLDENKNTKYVGMGRWARPYMHSNDLLKKCVNQEWTCCIVAAGLTNLEARIFEALSIKTLVEDYDCTLSARNAEVWDGKSLINKRREHKYERLISEWIN